MRRILISSMTFERLAIESLICGHIFEADSVPVDAGDEVFHVVTVSPELATKLDYHRERLEIQKYDDLLNHILDVAG